MKNILNSLRQYQEVILEIRQLNHALSAYPESVEALARELKQTRTAVNRVEEQLDADKRQRENRDNYLKLCRENLEKYEHDLMGVSNQREYSAVLKEIDTTKREIQETESALLKLKEDIEKMESELESLHSQVEEREQSYEKAVSEFNQVNEEKVRRKSEQEREMVRLQKAIPASYMRKFTQIASRRGGVAVSWVVDDCCSACNMKIRPQQINEMKRHPDSLYTCDSCQRILVIRPDNDSH